MENEEYLFGFEKLKVWHEAIDLLVFIYEVTSEFPNSEKYNLIIQSTRAATSISLNIAEGSGRLTPKDQNKFYSISYTSSLEVVSCMAASNKLDFITKADFIEVKKSVMSITSKLNAMHKNNLNKL